MCARVFVSYPTPLLKHSFKNSFYSHVVSKIIFILYIHWLTWTLNCRWLHTVNTLSHTHTHKHLLSLNWTHGVICVLQPKDLLPLLGNMCIALKYVCPLIKTWTLKVCQSSVCKTTRDESTYLHIVTCSYIDLICGCIVTEYHFLTVKMNHCLISFCHRTWGRWKRIKMKKEFTLYLHRHHFWCVLMTKFN